MTPEISERSFEATMDCALFAGGPGAFAKFFLDWLFERLLQGTKVT